VRPPPLARSTLDRAAHLRTDAGWLAGAWPTARVVVVDTVGGGTTLVRDAPEPRLVLLSADRAPAAEPSDRLFLGVDSDGVAVFAVDAPLPGVPDTRAVTLRNIGHLLDDRDTGLFTAALALANWHVSHRYSAVTGQPTRVSQGGWSRVDPDGVQNWPRTDPAVITLVHDGAAGPDGRCLLGHAGEWRAPGVRRFSCLAGFVEAGESAEAAVVREVREEVGVTVGQIVYVGSQAWPFPASLMLAFTAYADPEQPVRVDPTEIAEARWFNRREVVAAMAGQRVDLDGGDALRLPMSVSIAAYLIRQWADEAPE